MSNTKLVSAILGTLVSGYGLAGTMGSPMSDPWQRVLSVSIGPVWQEHYHNQTFFLQPDIEKTYTSTNSNSPLASGEVFLGLQHALNPLFAAQIGIAGVWTSAAQVRGEIWDDASPQFNNLAYSYKLQHSHVAVKGKLLADVHPMITPYVNASVGIGFNKAYSFNNHPLIFEAVANPNFRSHTETDFTYNLGAGLQHAFSQNWIAGIGYEFADWGNNRLDAAPEQTIGTGIAHDHLYTNGLMLSLTYLS